METGQPTVLFLYQVEGHPDDVLVFKGSLRQDRARPAQKADPHQHFYRFRAVFSLALLSLSSIEDGLGLDSGDPLARQGISFRSVSPAEVVAALSSRDTLTWTTSGGPPRLYRCPDYGPDELETEDILTVVHPSLHQKHCLVIPDAFFDPVSDPDPEPDR